MICAHEAGSHQLIASAKRQILSTLSFLLRFHNVQYHCWLLRLSPLFAEKSQHSFGGKMEKSDFLPTPCGRSSRIITITNFFQQHFFSPSLIFSNTRFILNYIFQHSHSQVARRSNSKHHKYSVISHLGQKLFMNEQQSAKNLNNSVILLER